MLLSLPNIMDLLARLQNYTIFSSLDLRSGYHHISSTSEAKPKTDFATNGEWHWNIAPFGICSLPDVFCYLYVAGIVWFWIFVLCNLDDILAYSAS